MIEHVVLVGDPLDGQRRASSGGNVLSVASAPGTSPLVYRRTHDESKFFRFSGQGA